jgi:hypothetical protein
MGGRLTSRWLCPPPFWRRRRALQAPASPGLQLRWPFAFGSGSGLAVRRRMAGVKASYGRKNEGTTLEALRGPRPRVCMARQADSEERHG